MATNKNAQLRYQILDRCFSNFQIRYTIDDLLEEVNKHLYDISGITVSKRLILDDIKYMRERLSHNAPIVAYNYEGKKCYYRYSNPDFHIYNNELSVTDINKLQSVIDMLARFRGTATNVWLEEVISNLEYRFGLKSNAEHLVSFELNEQLKGVEHLADIIDATINHQTLEIVYLTFKGKEITMTIHPYYVKQYNGRWFLYDFSTYFDDVMGATIPNDNVKKETIGLRFSANRFPYVVSKPIHKSQKVVDEDNCVVEIQVRPTRELTQQLFSFIPDVEVLYPEWYRCQIMEKIEENLKKYSSMKIDCTDKA